MPALPSASSPSHGPVPLQVWVQQADELRARRALDDALKEYRAILLQHPKERAARRGLVATLIGQGNHSEALSQIDRALQDDPDDIEMWRDRAALCRAVGDPTELLRTLQTIEKLVPGDRDVLWEEFQLCDVMGEKEEAYRHLGRLLEASEGSSDAGERGKLLLRRAELAETLGREDEAQEGYGLALTSPDSDVMREAATRGVRLALRRDRLDLALSMATKSIPSTPEGPEVPTELWALRAQVLLRADRLEEAQDIYDRLRARDPSDASALEGAVRARLDQGKHPEAREMLHEALRRIPRSESLILALAEAESGCGDLLAAERAVRDGLDMVPASRALWIRLAEIASARSDWEGASVAYDHALQADPDGVDALLGAAFVAEQRERFTEALTFYDRAGAIAGDQARVWTRRGLVLASMERHAEAVESFDRALILDPESDAAREGRKLADRVRHAREADRQALAALRLESQLGRPVTKNDLFVQLRIPFDQLEPVLTALSRQVPVDIASLEPAAFADLEERSCQLISAAFDRRPPGIENRGLSVADVAALSPSTDSLIRVQQLFGYIDAVLRMDIRPENLRLTPQAEEVARRALQLPPEERTLFGMVRTLRIGIFQARVVKTVERASDAAHPPLPAVDLASHSPEFREIDEPVDGSTYFAPAPAPVALPRAESSPKPSGGRRSHRWPLGVGLLGTQRAAARDGGSPRCIACGGIASVVHGCGATLCQPCTHQFGRCPKCGAPFAEPTTPAPHDPIGASGPFLSAAAPRAPSVRPAPPVAVLPQEVGLPPPQARPTERSRPPPNIPPPLDPKARSPSTARAAQSRSEALPPAKAAGGGKRPESAARSPGPLASGSAPPTPRPRRDRPDDEPRL